MEAFGEAVRRLRGSTSLRALAHRAHVDPGHLSKVENGLRRPTVFFAQALDSALGAGGVLVELARVDEVEASRAPVQRRVSVEPMATGVVVDGHHDVLASVASFLLESDQGLLARDVGYRQLVERLAVWVRRTGRRDLLQWLGYAISAAVATPFFGSLDDDDRVAPVLAGSRRVDGAIADGLDAVLQIYIRQDDTLVGSQATLDATIAHRALVRQLLPQATGELRRRLLSIYAGMARLAGWLAFDLTNFDAAAAFYESARVAAHEAQDTRLAAFVLCNMSHLATWRGQARLGIDHAIAAQMWADQTDDLPLRAYASDVAARAFAADKNEAMCRRYLDLARANLAASDGGPSMVHFYNEDLLNSIEGLCFLALSRPDRAVERFEAADLDQRYLRNVAFNLIDLGRARSALGDLAAAAETLGEAVTLTWHNRSSRLSREITAARAELGPGQTTKAVTELDDRLQAAGLA